MSYTEFLIPSVEKSLTVGRRSAGFRGGKKGRRVWTGTWLGSNRVTALERRGLTNCSCCASFGRDVAKSLNLVLLKVSISLGFQSEQDAARQLPCLLASLCFRVFSQLVSLSLRLRNGVKYCKVLRLPEVSKSTLFLIFLSAAAV